MAKKTQKVADVPAPAVPGSGAVEPLMINGVLRQPGDPGHPGTK